MTMLVISFKVFIKTGVLKLNICIIIYGWKSKGKKHFPQGLIFFLAQSKTSVPVTANTNIKTGRFKTATKVTYQHPYIYINISDVPND